MKSQLRLCLLFSLLVFLISCGNDNSTGPGSDPDPDPNPNPVPNVVSKNIGPDGGEITSADGLLTLTLPAGALGNAETITITPLEADDLGSEFDDIEVEQAYELGPDGLEFDMPIIATFLTEQNPIAGPDSVEFVNEFLLTSDNGQAVELDSLRTIVDLDEGTVTVQGQLEHFSPLAQSLIQDKTKATGSFGFSGLPDEVIAGSDIISAILVAQVNQVTEGEEPFMVTKAILDQMLEFPLVAVSPGEGNTEFPPENALFAELEYQCPIEGEGSLLLRGGFFDDNPRQGESEFSQSPSLQFGLFKRINCVEQMPTNFNLQVALDGDGLGTVSSKVAGINCPGDCEEDYEEGTKVTLTATPDQGSVFAMWSGDIAENAPQDSVITVTMDQARTISGIFDQKQAQTFTLTVQKDGEGTGTVTSKPSGIDFGSDNTEDYAEGTMVTLTATPDQGSEFVTWSGDFGSNAPQDSVITVTMDRARLVTATFELEQVNSGFLQLGLFTLPVLTNPETIVVLGGPEQAFANFPSGSVPALVQGAEGFIVIDLINGEVLLDITGLPGNASNGERIPLGALAVSRPGPGPNTLSVIVSYGQDNNDAEFGFNLFPYDIENQSFIRGPVSPHPSSVDASAIGGNIVSDEVVIVREGGFGINFMRYNEISDEYQLRPSREALVSARYGFEQPVTAFGEFVDGPLLVVNIIGDLYFEPRNPLIYSPSVLIGNVGEKIIKLRCKIPICVTTDESGDALTIILWDGLNQPIIGDRLQVGDGPVDPDLYELPNGNTLIGAPGFNANTISLLQVDPVGIFISGQIYNAPDGLVNPAHFHFINNPDDPTNPFVSITGFGSDNYYIQDTIEIGKLTLNAGVRPIE